MDFIERIFSMAPDGGSGIFEAALLLAPLLTAALFAAAKLSKRSRLPR